MLNESQEGHSALRHLAAKWLKPISESQPTGIRADLEPAFESVLQEIAKLDAPSGGVVDWAMVVKCGDKILQTQSKDIRMACRVAYGLKETQGLEGCVRGLALVAELTDLYWEGLYPSLRRIRGRVGTLNWLIARLETDLSRLEPTEADRKWLLLLSGAVERLESVVQERFKERGPSLQPLLRNVARLHDLLPRQPLSTGGSASDVQSSPSAGVAATEPAAAIESPPSNGSSEDGAGKVSPSEASPSETSSTTSSETAEEEDPDKPVENEALSSMREEVISKWLGAISSDQPAGIDAKYEESFELVNQEIAKLNAVGGGSVKWPTVVEHASGILANTSKDLTMASYLAAAWLETNGLEGLNRGLVLLVELNERYWESMFPPVRRIRARSRILSWVFERLIEWLGEFVPAGTDRSQVLLLQETSKQCDEVLNNRFDGDGPMTHSLVRGAERALMSLPSDAPEPVAPEPVAAEPAKNVHAETTAMPRAEQAQAAPPAIQVKVDEPEAFQAGADATDYLLKVGDSLIRTAHLLREQASTDPTSFRILRQGIWLHASALPTADAQSKTMFKCYPESLLTQFVTMAASGEWQTLLNETESAMTTYRFWFDLHRMSAAALTSLGPSYAKARHALITELGNFLRHLPDVTSLCFSNGTPFADSETLDWIQQEVHVAGEAAGASPGAGADMQDYVDQVRSLVAEGMGLDAIDLLQGASERASSARVRFRLRLLLAETSKGVGQMALAKAVYEDLHKEAEGRDLARWDPELAIEVLGGYFRVVRAIGISGKDIGDTADILFERLCVLKPALAMVLVDK